MKKSIIKWVVFAHLCIIVGIGLYIVTVLLVAYFNDYQPDKKENLTIVPRNAEISIEKTETQFSILSWNIGYCGLGKEQDFFYDGGSMVRPNIEDYKKYINGIFAFLSQANYLDFIFLQEVDINSKRSYYTNQLDVFKEALPNLSYVYATNYNVGYVPMPFFEPMGKVNAGMVTWSHYVPENATRIGFDVNFSWWKRIFMLDRCLIVTRHKLVNGKELVMINLHNSAFDDENKLKPVELKALKQIMVDEFSRGNYVVAGGDWNQNPPKFDANLIAKKWNPVGIEHPIATDFLPKDWNWSYPKGTPTERFNDKPFEKGKNKTTTIDFFVTSPNVKVHSIEAINLDFLYSDHQPVLMTFDIASDSTNIEN